jgi:regulator of nucleoside diphosphate kinase
MHTVLRGERTLTELDFSRLRKLASGNLAPELADLLSAADVLHSREVPADTVTMYSQVELQDLHARRRQKLTICYPDDAEPSAGFISVLSPVGRSLLGLQVGAVARWQTPSGEEGAAEVVAILFQPEASGDYAL